jgi:hypothetical protein
MLDLELLNLKLSGEGGAVVVALPNTETEVMEVFFELYLEVKMLALGMSLELGQGEFGKLGLMLEFKSGLGEVEIALPTSTGTWLKP